MIIVAIAATHLVVGFIGGCLVRHYAHAAFLPLSNDAKKLRDEVVAHLDAMIGKSEITLRHDAKAFRDLIAGR